MPDPAPSPLSRRERNLLDQQLQDLLGQRDRATNPTSGGIGGILGRAAQSMDVNVADQQAETERRIRELEAQIAADDELLAASRASRQPAGQGLMARLLGRPQ